MMDDYSSTTGIINPRKRALCTGRVILTSAVVLILGLLIGILIGYYGKKTGDCHVPIEPSSLVTNSSEADRILELIKQKMSAANIENNLKKYTSFPHLAGTANEVLLGDMIMNEWKKQGLDYVTKTTYKTLFSYPNDTDKNVITLKNGSQILFQSQLQEKPVDPTLNRTDIVSPFNAYSPPGDVQGELVYVNYGRIEDFEQLANITKLNLSSFHYIAIVRYGKIFRGDKVDIAASYGAKAVIIYSDPSDYSIDVSVPGYPDSWWLPPTGVQRGTAKTSDGDPMTPGYPAIDSAYRVLNPDLPKIPVHPISYGDAIEFLGRMKGPEVPESWRGKLNITYRLGPGFKDKELSVNMHIATYSKLSNTSNIFGYIRGSEEPDRYVILGNHYDAWVFGGVDPTSGTSVLMEVSRVLADIVKNDNWRPKRTILFCAWGAEEYGLIGSYEWVEEQVKILSDRAVAYLNVDLAIEGNSSMRAKGMPSLYPVLFESAKKVSSGNDPQVSLYDEWMKNFPDTSRNTPKVLSMGGGSDFGSFVALSGVASYDVRYTHNFPIIDYPLYHSSYETFNLVKSYIDSEFKMSLAIGQFWAESARNLADSLIIPINTTIYAEMLTSYVSDLKKEKSTDCDSALIPMLCVHG